MTYGKQENCAIWSRICWNLHYRYTHIIIYLLLILTLTNNSVWVVFAYLSFSLIFDITTYVKPFPVVKLSSKQRKLLDWPEDYPSNLIGTIILFWGHWNVLTIFIRGTKDLSDRGRVAKGTRTEGGHHFRATNSSNPQRTFSACYPRPDTCFFHYYNANRTISLCTYYSHYPYAPYSCYSPRSPVILFPFFAQFYTCCGSANASTCYSGSLLAFYAFRISSNKHTYSSRVPSRIPLPVRISTS